MPVYNPKSTDELNDLLKSLPCVVVDFYAHWCAPCKQLLTYFEEDKWNEYNVIKININNENFEDYCKEFDVVKIPFLVFYSNGIVSNKLLGTNKELINNFNLYF